MTVHQIKITRPDEDETAYFWKLYHAAQRNDNRWGGWNVQDIAEELKSTDLDRKQKLFLLRAWQVLVDDNGGFGRFMSAFETYVLNMQDPEQDVVAWKPEIIRMSEDADLLPILLEAYQEARQRIAADYEIKARLCKESNSLSDRMHAKPHHNGMMQLSNELADAKAALRRLATYARTYAGDIQYTGDHPIAVAEKLAGRELHGNTEQLDTAAAQFESLAGERVSEPYKLRDAEHVASVLESIGSFEAGDIDSDVVDLRFEVDGVDTGTDVSITEFAARGAAIIRQLSGNSPVTPDGWVMVPVEPTIEMRKAFHKANDEADSFVSPDHQWDAMLTAAPRQEVKS